MTTTTPPEPVYVSLIEAARRLSVSEDTLRRQTRGALHAGHIASLKLGRRRVVHWEALCAWLVTHCNGGMQ